MEITRGGERENRFVDSLAAMIKFSFFALLQRTSEAVYPSPGTSYR